VLTHGAGANCQSNLLVAVSNALADAGFKVLRCDLPFRQMRPHGPPFPASAERDQQGVRRAIAVLRARTAGRLFVGGHSYGGRQATMLVAEEPQLVEGMLLLSYPLHPPRKPSELRVGHFSKLVKPVLFVHGTRDLFGSIGEMKSALERIPARNTLLEVSGMGHDLWPKNSAGDLPARIATAFQTFFTQCSPRIDQT
jgi:predicted alpha/beta-hydrolase family hydrolase